jgi:Negative regulator of beta-lactamase expression
MRTINHIVLHCTAGPQDQKTTDIKAYWAKKLGWKTYGYHYLVSGDGSVENLVSIEKPSNGVAGHNSNSIHVCYKGGWNGKDTRTEAQKTALLSIITALKVKFPQAKILGHRDFSPDLNGDGKITSNEWVKLCPCFDAKTEYLL